MTWFSYIPFKITWHPVISGNDPVDGAWSPWSQYGACVVSCGQGTRERFRQCNNPVPSNGGVACVGNELDHDVCYGDPCPREFFPLSTPYFPLLPPYNALLQVPNSVIDFNTHRKKILIYQRASSTNQCTAVGLIIFR